MINTASLWMELGNITDENKWNLIRYYRDKLISQSDWTQLTDVALTQSERIAWSEYRQALRNIPQLFEEPDDVVFPEAPK